MNHFLETPAELLVNHIVPYLDLVDLCRLKQLSRMWRFIIDTHLLKLKQFDIRDLDKVLTEFGLSCIIAKMSRLREIYVDGCWMAVSKNNLFHLFHHCRQIELFSARHCKFIDDEILEELGAKCFGLESVDISSCFQITSAGIKSLFKRCPNLKVFSASKNYGFKDDALEFIGENSSSLIELDIGSCFYITDIGLTALLNGICKKLSYIRITGCTKVTDVVAQKFVERRIVVNNCY
eukprot:gene3025-3484_t